MAKTSALLSFLAGTLEIGRMNEEDFSLLIAEARSCGLLERVAQMLPGSSSDDWLSPRQSDQLLAAAIYSKGFRKDAWRELGYIEQALSHLQTPVILLKGAAYLCMGLPLADGRVFSDIDLHVSKEHVGPAEAALMLGGWATGSLDAYDQRYYRQWSHEIPPMTHLQRGTTVDLHHSLVMPTCRVKVDSQRMTAAALPVSANGFWWRLKDEDMVLHAASHLVLNSTFDRGLRDLWDINLLYRQFTESTADFPARLQDRACEVGLEAVLAQALFLTSNVFMTDIPECMLPAGKNVFLSMATCAISTRHPETRPRGQSVADLALMLREMYLRLPSNLLWIHATHKVAGLFETPQKATL